MNDSDEMVIAGGSITQICYLISVGLMLASYRIAAYESQIWASIGAFVFLLIFAVLFRTDVEGIARRFKGLWLGMFISVYGIIIGVLGLILYGMLLIWPWLWGMISGFMVDILAVSTSIFIGAFFVTARKYFSNSGLWTATGVIYIVGGMSFLIVRLTFLSAPFVFPLGKLGILLVDIVVYLLFVLILASITGALSFLLTKPIENP